MIMENTADFGLIKTKYSIPAANKRLLPRGALNRRLEDSLSRRLTVITAPAGYGKTSAALKWLEGISLPSAWLSIDEGDNDAILFWRYFCASLDAVSAGISRDTEYVFASKELFEANIHQSILVDRLSAVPSDFFLVLDDFHLITNRVVLDSLSFFISWLPANMHLVLIGRTEPRLNLARLGLKEDLIRIRANELRFDTEEISRYYETRGYFLQKEEVLKIETYTEGWAAALVAVALSLRNETNRHAVINSFGSCNPQIESYLSEDVFHMWTEEQQDFMERTSILDQLCGPLCEALAGSGGGRLLKELYEQNSFLVALDQEDLWFRYHHLFLDFLRKRLSEKGAPPVRELHRKAGDWLKANGFYHEAIEHYFNSAYYEGALLIFQENAAALVRQGEFPKAMSWIGKLPAEYAENAPRIILVKILCLTAAGDFQKAWEYLKRIEPAINERTAPSDFIRTEYLLVKTNLLMLQGNIEESFSTFARVAAGADKINMYFADFNLYDISMYRCPYDIFIKMLIKKPAGYESFFNNYKGIIASSPGYFQLSKGEAWYEIGKIEEALPELIAAVDSAANAACPGALVPATVTLAKIRRARGDISGAMEMIEECERRVADFHRPHWGYMLRAFKARLYIDMGDTEMVDDWMKGNRLEINQEITRTREYELLVLARALIYKRRYHDAGILLTRLSNFAEGLNRRHSLVEINNLLAITAIKNLNEDSAVKHLEKALSTGMEEGYLNSFVDELAPMISLLELYIGKHSKEDRLEDGLAAYAAKILGHTKDRLSHFAFAADPDTVGSLLTSTEKKVLRLLKNAYTNKEIAAELGITLRTAKAHTGSIYKKLGVKTRMQCLKKISDKPS